MCHVPHRKIVGLWNAFDKDINGYISFTEVNKASLCNLADSAIVAYNPNCDWILDVMEPEIAHRAEWGEYLLFETPRIES